MSAQRQRLSGAWLRVRHLLALMAKEALQLARDPALLAFMLYAFTADIYLAGSGVTMQLDHARLVALDRDKSALSRELIDAFTPPAFSFAGEVRDETAALELLAEGEAMLVLDIPEDFSDSLARQRPAEAQLLVDTSYTVLGTLASGHAETIAAEFGRRALRETHGPASPPRTLPLVRTQSRVWFNPAMKDTWFMGLTELMNIVSLFAILLPAAAMVREKEKGTLEQLLVSPLSALEIMLPKVLAMSLVILAGTALALYGVLVPVFGMPAHGAWLFFALTALYVVTGSGVGLIISTLSDNLGQAGMLTILVFGPMIFLSGAWTPPEAMPAFMRHLMLVFPLHHYLDAGLAVLLRGAGAALVKDAVFALGATGAAVFALGMWRLRRQFG